MTVYPPPAGRVWVPRYLVTCACGYRVMTKSRPDAVIISCRRCPGPDHLPAMRGAASVRRIEFRAPKGIAVSCRQGDRRDRARTVGGFDKVPEGRCAWDCLNSLSPICRCEKCRGSYHGETQIQTLDLDRVESPSELYDRIEASRPRGDWKGRKST